MGRACLLCPSDSDINLFGNRERVGVLREQKADHPGDIIGLAHAAKRDQLQSTVSNKKKAVLEFTIR